MRRRRRSGRVVLFGGELVAYLLGAGELGPGVVDVVLDPIELGLVVDDRGQPADDYPAQDEAEQRRDQAADRNALPVTPACWPSSGPRRPGSGPGRRTRPRPVTRSRSGRRTAPRPKTRANTAAALVLAGRAVVTSRPPPCGVSVTRWEPSSGAVIGGAPSRGGVVLIRSVQRCADPESGSSLEPVVVSSACSLDTVSLICCWPSALVTRAVTCS